MNYRNLVIYIFGVLLVGFGSTSFVLAVPVMQDGEVLEEPSDLKNWSGLYLLRESRSVIAPVEITVQKYFSEVADDSKFINDETHWSGRRLIVHPKSTDPLSSPLVNEREAQQLILIVQSPKLIIGPVATTFPGNLSVESRSLGDFGPLEELQMQLHKDFYILSTQYSDCRVMLVQEQRGVSGRSHSTKTQCLFPPPKVALESPLYCNSGWPSLVWAGDLDGDRILDLVFDIRSDSTYERKLFLSKGAKKGLVVSEAGSFLRPSGC